MSIVAAIIWEITAPTSPRIHKIRAAVVRFTLMVLDRAIRCGNDTSESVYDTRGLVFI